MLSLILAVACVGQLPEIVIDPGPIRVQVQQPAAPAVTLQQSACPCSQPAAAAVRMQPVAPQMTMQAVAPPMACPQAAFSMAAPTFTPAAGLVTVQGPMFGSLFGARERGGLFRGRSRTVFRQRTR